MVRRPMKACMHPKCNRPGDVLLKDLNVAHKAWIFCAEHVKEFLDTVSRADAVAEFEAYVHPSAAGLEGLLRGG